MHPCVHCSIIDACQDMKTMEVSFDRWLDKEVMVHVYHEILFSHKKGWNTAICVNVDGSSEYHAKQNNPEEKSQEPYDFTHMSDIKKQIKQDKQTKTQTQITAWWLLEEKEGA